jgi:hypothetical protein
MNRPLSGVESELTPEQIAEVERRLAEDDLATEAEVKDFFAPYASLGCRRER